MVRSAKVDWISIRESNGTGGVDVTTVFFRIQDDLTTTVGSISIGWPGVSKADSFFSLKEKLNRVPQTNELSDHNPVRYSQQRQQ